MGKVNDKPGSVFDAEVKDLASDGRGVVAHPSGRTLFAAGVWPGERARFRVLRLKGRIGFAECLELLSSSEHRIEPICVHHGHSASTCGGCPWQFVDYPAQVAAKQRRVDDSFRRIGVRSVNPLWESEAVFGYRNRAQLKTDGQRIGFVSAHSHALAPIEDCLVLSEHNRQTLHQLRKRLPNPAWRPTKKKEKWCTLDIDENTSADGVSLNQRLPFRQANAGQNTKLRRWLAEKLQPLNRDTTVLELFCGSGNFTRLIANLGFEKVVAAEGVDAAIDDISALNHQSVIAIQADLFSEAGMAKVLKSAQAASILVLDPPREGVKILAPLLSKKRRLDHVLYISCDLATLVRDVGHFQKSGFVVRDVQPLDMFPQTPHIECMVLLARK